MTTDTLTRQRPTADIVTYARAGDTFGWFVARRSLRAATVWAAVIVLYHYVSVIGFFALGSTAAARQPVLATFETNAGLTAMLGDPSGITAIGGYLDWRVIGVMSLVTGVWAMLTATRWLRGEETSGRWEQVTSGPTTAAATTVRILAGLGTGLAAIWLITSIGVAAVGVRHDVATAIGAAALFGLVIVATPAMFIAVGALASQLMATRARAAATAALVFGIAFTLRALGDVAPTAHWLTSLSPLGWVEQVHPLSHPQPLWLLPILAFTAIVGGLAVRLAGRRDLGSSIIADRDTAVPRTLLLSRPLLFAVRMARGSSLAWLAGTAIAALLYGTFAKSAQTAVANSKELGKITSTIVGNTDRASTLIYAGVVFLLMMTMLMAYAVAAMGNIRETEAEGYLDNLLVRRVTRLSWLGGRIGIVATVVVIAGLVSGVGFWAGAATQHADLSGGELILAGLNACAPPLCLLGILVCVYGFAPRATTTVGYTVLAWAFLLQMLGAAIHLNPWLMDTSLLHHIALAPTVDPNWRIVATYLTLGAVLAATGAWRFHHRDLQTA